MFVEGLEVLGVAGGLIGFLGTGGCMGGAEEGNMVVAPTAPLRRDPPSEQRTLARGPVLRQRGRVLCTGDSVLGRWHPNEHVRSPGTPPLPQAGICRAVGAGGGERQIRSTPADKERPLGTPAFGNDRKKSKSKSGTATLILR